MAAVVLVMGVSQLSSIEWNKGILKDLVIDTKETKSTSTNKKPEKFYKLAKKITPKVREKAQEKIYKNAISHKQKNKAKL